MVQKSSLEDNFKPTSNWMEMKTHILKLVVSTEAVLTGELITLSAHLWEEKGYQINNLSSYFKKLEKRTK